MNALFTGTVATVYAGAVVGLHRWNVWRLRRVAGGFPALRRLDWAALLDGLESDLEDPRRALLSEISSGTLLADVGPRAEVAGFSGGQAAWLELVALAQASPDTAYERLQARRLTTPAELYLREYLRLTQRTNPLNLELSVFTSKTQLTAGLVRFGEAPGLYFARALASSLIGFNRAAIDDLARAVYYSHQAPFYVQAVLDSAFVEEARPPLVYQCRQAALTWKARP